MVSPSPPSVLLLTSRQLEFLKVNLPKEAEKRSN